MREKIFYSGLLIFEMYGTMSALEDLYFQHESIPLPKEKFLKIQARRGFGVDSIGTRSTIIIMKQCLSTNSRISI